MLNPLPPLGGGGKKKEKAMDRSPNWVDVLRYTQNGFRDFRRSQTPHSTREKYGDYRRQLRLLRPLGGLVLRWSWDGGAVGGVGAIGGVPAPVGPQLAVNPTR